MDEIQRFTRRQDDSDALIRGAVGVGKSIGFSENGNDSDKSVTEGLKQVLQGFYKGVRNPVPHSYEEFARLETFQILASCSFLLSRMQLPGADDE